jgi:hypothetical protein
VLQRIGFGEKGKKEAKELHNRFIEGFRAKEGEVDIERSACLGASEYSGKLLLFRDGLLCRLLVCFSLFTSFSLFPGTRRV